jgi:thiol-disulfide isomerase/thioredoxin
MRIRYFALLAMVSVLSIGAVTSCSNPTSTSSTETAAKVNPCAAKANPCAAKANPCAAKANPCAAKAKPSGDKAGGLAAELQGKPVVVDVYASWCPACKNVAPTLETLKKEYAGKANFVVLDVSDKTTTAKATARAKELGLDKFLAKNLSQTGLIAIFDPATGEILSEGRNEPAVDSYKKPLDAFIAKAK